MPGPAFLPITDGKQALFAQLIVTRFRELQAGARYTERELSLLSDANAMNGEEERIYYIALMSALFDLTGFQSVANSFYGPWSVDGSPNASMLALFQAFFGFDPPPEP